jgi:C1A family cysteine protease
LIPKSIDWRDHGVVNPVRSQGKCGSCWTFSAIGVIESLYAIKTGKLL